MKICGLKFMVLYSQNDDVMMMSCWCHGFITLRWLTRQAARLAVRLYWQMKIFRHNMMFSIECMIISVECLNFPLINDVSSINEWWFLGPNLGTLFITTASRKDPDKNDESCTRNDGDLHHWKWWRFASLKMMEICIIKYDGDLHH